MALPSVPSNFVVQPGNGQVYLSWDNVADTTSYTIERSVDNVTFSSLDTQTGNTYSDDTAVVGTEYWYRVYSTNGTGDSNPTESISATNVDYGSVSLGWIRQRAQERSDMVNNNFVTTQEWNSYITNSYKELYDILVQVYADEYYVATPYSFTTDGRYPGLYPLPADCYKLMGVDLGISGGNDAFLTLRKFSFQERNRYIYGNTPVSWFGRLQLKYRMVGNDIWLVPQPQANQTIQLWYVPRPNTLVADNNLLDGISGWEEYVIVDSAIKALQKEESDVSVLMAQKVALRERITAAASNRDQGEPERVVDVRSDFALGGPFGDGPFGGV